MAGGVNIGAPCMDATLRSGGAVRGKREAVLLNAAATAAEAGTIPYEVLCAVGKTRNEFTYSAGYRRAAYLLSSDENRAAHDNMPGYDGTSLAPKCSESRKIYIR